MNIQKGTLFLLVAIPVLLACEASQKTEKKAYSKAFTDCERLLKKQAGTPSTTVPYVKDHGTAGDHYFIWDGDDQIRLTTSGNGEKKEVFSLFATCRHNGTGVVSIKASTQPIIE